MLDNLDPREPGTTPEQARAPEAPASHRPMTDREVPLTGRRTPAAVHAWLDGELPESAVRLGDTVRDVEFWLRLDREAEARRQMRTPPYVYQQIMDALPESAPSKAVAWWRRPFEITPVVALATIAGLVALGAMLGITMLQRTR